MPRRSRPYDSLLAESRPITSHRHRGKPRSGGSLTRAILLVLGIMLVAIPTISLPDEQYWLGVKAGVMEAVGIVAAALVFSRGEWTWQRVRAALLAPPNLAIMGFLAWVGLSLGKSDLPELSKYEAMRHLGGGLIYFSVVYGLSVRRHLGRFVGFVLLAGSLGAIMAFLAYGETRTSRLAGAFRNEQLLAAFLALLLPVVLLATLKDAGAQQEDKDLVRRLAAQVVTIILVAGILVSQNRSAWAAAGVSTIVIVLLHLRFASKGIGIQKHLVLVPVLMVFLAAGLFFWVSRTGSLVTARAESMRHLTGDQTLRWRLGMWDKALRMVRHRPLFGWGVGTFPVNQALYFHPDTLMYRTQRQIIEDGPNLADNAHNTYLQVAAELGVPGLLLFLTIYLAFFTTALRAAPGVKAGFRQSMLFASVGGVTSQMVSAVGSPAWEFAECSLFLWLLLGMGMAIAGVGERGRDSGKDGDGDENNGQENWSSGLEYG